MSRLYAMKVTKQDTDFLEELSSYFQQERRAQLLRCKDKHKATCSACGEWMARVLIGEKMRQKPFLLKYQKGQYGKPSIENAEYKFNISHSGEWVFCGISKEAIGIDVEKIKGIIEKIATRCFTQREREWLKSKSDIEQPQFFYTLWTLKESYVKYKGEGLRIPLNSVEFACCDGQMRMIEHVETVNECALPVDVFTGIWKEEYAYSVIGSEPLEETVIELSLQEILKQLANKSK